MKRRVLAALALTLSLTGMLVGCGGSKEESAPAEVQSAPAEVSSEVVSEVPEEEEAPVEEVPEVSVVEEEPEEEAPVEIVPEYYEEQPEMPTINSITGIQESGSGKMGPMDNGKYLACFHAYKVTGTEREELETAYIAFLTEAGYEVAGDIAPEDLVEVNSETRINWDEDEEETYHILKDGEIAAVLTFVPSGSIVRIYLKDAWEPGRRPEAAADAGEPKETAYGKGTYYVSAKKDDTYIDFTFVDGVLTTQLSEGMDGKGGMGEGYSTGIEYSEYNGMTVEELMESLEKNGYTAAVGEDQYKVMMEIQ